jgi:uncharacterized protein
MSVVLTQSQRLARPSRFGYLMALYGENHLRLQRMFRPAQLAADHYRSSIGDGLDLRLDIIERHAYTTELRLTYEMRDAETGHPEPSAYLRMYRDARQVEVTHCYIGTRWQDALKLHASTQTLLAHRLRMNAFLSRWLEYLAELGHSRATLEALEGVPDDARLANIAARA